MPASREHSWAASSTLVAIADTTRSDPNNAEAVDACGLLRDIFGRVFRRVIVLPGLLSWNDRTVFRLAQTVYEERAFDCMPILADALEEAGCSDPDILEHLRGPGPHRRGCRVLDSCLGLS